MNNDTKTIEDLRARLFETIDAVKAGAIDINQAAIIGSLSQTIINSAKVEVDYIRAVEKTDGSKFLGHADDDKRNGITGIVRHRLKG